MKQNQASATALTVLQGIILTAMNPRYSHLINRTDLSFYRHVLYSSPQGRHKLSQVNSSIQRPLLMLSEKLLIPGIALHYVLRKNYIEQITEQAIEQGYDQVVNLGAGYDSLCQRFAQRFPSVQFIEVDHPKGSQLKQQLSQQLFPSRNNLAYVQIDFEQQELTLHQNSNFSRNKKTLFICEGVLMYLRKNTINSLLNNLANSTQMAPRLIFSAIPPFESEHNNCRYLLKLILKCMREPLHWFCEQADIEQWLNRQNYRLISRAGALEFKTLFLDNSAHQLHFAEYLTVAEPR